MRRILFVTERLNLSLRKTAEYAADIPFLRATIPIHLPWILMQPYAHYLSDRFWIFSKTRRLILANANSAVPKRYEGRKWWNWESSYFLSLSLSGWKFHEIPYRALRLASSSLLHPIAEVRHLGVRCRRQHFSPSTLALVHFSLTLPYLVTIPVDARANLRYTKQRCWLAAAARLAVFILLRAFGQDTSVLGFTMIHVLGPPLFRTINMRSLHFGQWDVGLSSSFGERLFFLPSPKPPRSGIVKAALRRPDSLRYGASIPTMSCRGSSRGRIRMPK